MLANQDFDPETVRDMSLALERVCERLDFRVQDNPATRLAASCRACPARGLRGTAPSAYRCPGLFERRMWGATSPRMAAALRDARAGL